MTTKPTKTAPAKDLKAKALKAKAPAVKVVAVKLATVKPTKKAPAKLAKEGKSVKSAASAVRPLRLFQVKVDAQAPSDPHCEPFTLPTGGSLPLIAGMRLLSQDLSLQSSALWGLLPDDFTPRTGLDSTSLGQAIAASPGFDVYFCHAHPELESVYHNTWLQAETTHPHFLVLAREFLKAADLPDTPLDNLSHSSLFATGHLIVASPAFWADYLAFIETALSQVHLKIGKTARAALFEEQTPAGKFSYLYLIVARLLGHFLIAKGSTWKACKLALPQDSELNPHLRLLREMKDNAVTQQSRWLTACWANYRALYFSQTLGKSWIANNLAAISPKVLKFGPAVPGIAYAYPRTTEGASV